MEELSARLIVFNAPALTGVTYLEVIARFGSAAELLAAGTVAWHEAGLPLPCSDYLQAHRDHPPAHARRWLDMDHHWLIMRDDPRYPVLLAQLPDAPLGLFVDGDPDWLNQPQLAVVGSRNPTPYGRQLAERFAQHLARCGLSITSGLAMGIDAAAHHGALINNSPHRTASTLAVCGTGLDITYPRSSEALATRIRTQGALISEFMPGTPPRKHHFPQRNRIISGLSLGTLVVEAAEHSGSLITARLAGDQGREVFAIPGSIHSPLSKGCHALIRQGAKLVDSADDILSELHPLLKHLAQHRNDAHRPEPVDSNGISGPPLDKDYKILLDALGFEPQSIDHLVGQTGLSAAAIASMLLILELEGAVTPFPGGLYLRASP